MSDNVFRCYLVTQSDDEKPQGQVTERPVTELPEGEVLVRVSYSSLNYKDALAATGSPGVAKSLPHVPGIDAAGVVVESASGLVAKDDPVIVTSYELGAGRWGGWAEYIRVPAEWVIPLPTGLTLEGAMRLGTAGLTAGLSVETLQHQGITPDKGEVLVTGATGGVGSLAVMLLAKLGYEVVAVTGKADRHEWLQGLGAGRVVGREALADDSERPLLKAQWAGAVDTVGGKPLVNILRSTKVGGCVAACGLVASAKLSMTVFPFILRGVSLCGIDSAWCPRDRRGILWRKLADEWSMDGLEAISTTVPLEQVGAEVERILRGEMVGRVVVRI